MNALILEDNEEYAGFVKQALCGSSVTVVNNWFLALNELRKAHFDLIIVDWGCCNDSDRRSVDMLRAYAPDATIVAITGSTETLPKHFDAAEYKIRLSALDAMKNFFYNAIRERKRITPAQSSVQAVECVARLFSKAAIASIALIATGCASNPPVIDRHASYPDHETYEEALGTAISILSSR